MKAVLYGDYPSCEFERLRRLLSSDWQLSAVYSHASLAQKAAELADADALITSHYGTNDPVAPRLKLLQCSSAGTDDLDIARLPVGCIVCKAEGHESAVAEYVIWTILDWSLSRRKEVDFFSAGRWSLDEWTSLPKHEEVGGKTLGLIGFGHIGREVACRAKALGMHVLALSTWRHEISPKHLVDAAFKASNKCEFLGASDFLVVCCPLSEETAGMIDWSWFASMRRNTVFINVGRGPIVEEESLFKALQSGFIRGATIDVWYDYPAPAKPETSAAHFPFHLLSNVVRTPHIAALSKEAWDRRFRQIASNLEALVRGRPLQNAVQLACFDVGG